jgi:hypothetical protein
MLSNVRINDCVFIPIIPNLDKVVTSTSDKPSLLTRSGIRTYETARRRSWCPAYSVNTHAVSMEHLMGPAIVAEFQHADLTIRRGAGKNAATFMRSPRHNIH